MRFPQLKSREWLEERMKNGKQIKEVAEEIGCSAPNVIRAIKKFGLEWPTDRGEITRKMLGRRRKRLWPQLEDEAWLRQRYLADKKSIVEISEEIGCSTTALVYAFKRLGIIAREPGVARKVRGSRSGAESRWPQLYDEVWLRQCYVTDDKSVKEMAEEVGCSTTRIVYALSRFHISRKKRSKVTRSDAIPQLQTPEWLQENYIKKNRETKDLARELGCSRWTIQKWLDRHGILKFPQRPQEKKDKSIPKGQRIKSGYVYLYKPDHPSTNGRGWIAQHRLIVEEFLCRLLTTEEKVHHINANRRDNRLDNLILLPDHSTHMHLERHPPPWIPRCPHCGEIRPKLVLARPSWVPLIYDPVLTYLAEAPKE